MAKWQYISVFQKGKRSVCLKCPKFTKTEFQNPIEACAKTFHSPTLHRKLEFIGSLHTVDVGEWNVFTQASIGFWNSVFANLGHLRHTFFFSLLKNWNILPFRHFAFRHFAISCFKHALTWTSTLQQMYLFNVISSSIVLWHKWHLFSITKKARRPVGNCWLTVLNC